MRYLALVLLVVGGCAEFHVAVFCYVCAVVAMLWDISARLANAPRQYLARSDNMMDPIVRQGG